MLERHGKRGGLRALLIGAISPLSTRSFDVLAREEYDVSQTFAIDLENGTEKARHVHVSTASGLAIPFTNDSMDFVHTNQLFHRLEDPNQNNKSWEEMVIMLLTEIYRVLTPGGQLLMKELMPRDMFSGIGFIDEMTMKSFSKGMVDCLKDLGYKIAIVEQIHDISGVEYLFDPSRDFGRYKTKPLLYSSGIYAQKAAA